jgi:hypothetical protein
LNEFGSVFISEFLPTSKATQAWSEWQWDTPFATRYSEFRESCGTGCVQKRWESYLYDSKLATYIWQRDRFIYARDRYISALHTCRPTVRQLMAINCYNDRVSELSYLGLDILVFSSFLSRSSEDSASNDGRPVTVLQRRKASVSHNIRGRRSIYCWKALN